MKLCLLFAIFCLFVSASAYILPQQHHGPGPVISGGRGTAPPPAPYLIHCTADNQCPEGSVCFDGECHPFTSK